MMARSLDPKYVQWQRIGTSRGRVLPNDSRRPSGGHCDALTRRTLFVRIPTSPPSLPGTRLGFARTDGWDVAAEKGFLAVETCASAPRQAGSGDSERLLADVLPDVICDVVLLGMCLSQVVWNDDTPDPELWWFVHHAWRRSKLAENRRTCLTASRRSPRGRTGATARVPPPRQRRSGESQLPLPASRARWGCSARQSVVINGAPGQRSPSPALSDLRIDERAIQGRGSPSGTARTTRPTGQQRRGSMISRRQRRTLPPPHRRSRATIRRSSRTSGHRPPPWAPGSSCRSSHTGRSRSARCHYRPRCDLADPVIASYGATGGAYLDSASQDYAIGGYTAKVAFASWRYGRYAD